MDVMSFTAAQSAAVAVAVLIAGVAAFQLALAAGLPLGEAVLGGAGLVWVTWGIVVFLVLNTVANFSAPHPVERWVMGSITLVLSGLGLLIALKGPDVT